MIPWIQLDRTKTPDKKNEISLNKRGEEYSIRIHGLELMNSRIFGSEKKIAEIACSKISNNSKACIIIGGLGMGYTLSSALSNLQEDAIVTVVELIPAVINWNKEFFPHLADHPLNDPRVMVKAQDIVEFIKNSPKKADAIILDVDNGPEGLSQEGNNWLYGYEGLSLLKKSLKKGGNLAVWSAAQNEKFRKRLQKTGYRVEENTVYARANKKGSKHTIWIAINE